MAHRKDEPLTTFWNDVFAAVTHLEASDRPTNLTTLGDIVKQKTLPLHDIWTKDITPGVTTESQIQAMIYNFGVHLEHKSVEIDVPSTTTAAFSAVAPPTEKIRLLREQNALLAAANASRNRYNDRGHGRSRSRDRDRDRHSDHNRKQRVPICHACGRPGHVIRNCPTFTYKPGPSDIAFHAVFPAAVCVYPNSPPLPIHDDCSHLWVVDNVAT
jgi:hypothetical protein